MPTDVRRSQFDDTSIRAVRERESAARQAKQRLNSDLSKTGHPSPRERKRKARWARAHRDKLREIARRYRLKCRSMEASRFRTWFHEHRFYVAAYARVKRRLMKLDPPLEPDELKQRCRRLANRIAKRAGECSVG